MDSLGCGDRNRPAQALHLEGLDLFPALVASGDAGEPTDRHVGGHHHGVNVEPLRATRALHIRGARLVFTEPLLHVHNGHGCSLRPEHGSTVSGGRSFAMTASRRHSPKGPAGSWKTGQRAPITGYWKDQHGQVIHIEVGRTFPPCLDRQGECANRHLLVNMQTGHLAD